MPEIEFIKNLNCNYERILLAKKPEENRYQYCIVTRGGIRGLLDCSLRYINGQAYLYYDISSKQNLVQLFEGKKITRQWVKDFLWGMQRIRQEMERFLLDDSNILWHPEQIFQDLEKNDFYFIYMPYHEGKDGLEELLDYLVEQIDYEDETLVQCIYKMHEQYRLLGKVYLTEQIYEDGRKLDAAVDNLQLGEKSELQLMQNDNTAENCEFDGVSPLHTECTELSKENKKGIRYFLDGKIRKRKDSKSAVDYQPCLAAPIQAVCEETEYVGRTVYMEATMQEQEIHGLFTSDGKELFRLKDQSIIIGKKKEEADCILEDSSVSRMHARITSEKDMFYLEDLNSTNGTYKNGLRLQPYEKRKMDKEDEIRLGKIVLIFR